MIRVKVFEEFSVNELVHTVNDWIRDTECKYTIIQRLPVIMSGDWFMLTVWYKLNGKT